MNTSHQPQDRFSWLWLTIGAALLPFTSIQPNLPIAAWLAPIFLLRFTRTQRAAVGLPLIAVISCLAMVIPWWAFYSASPILVPVLSIVYGIVGTLGYAVDRLLTPRLPSAVRSLVFPVALTTVDLTMALVGPITNWGSPAYSQFGNLALMQIVSVSGMWGLTFLIGWGASAVNATWEQGFEWPALKRYVGSFTAVLIAALLFGGIRLAYFAPTSPTVRVAALAPSEAQLSSIFDLPNKNFTTEAAREAGRTRFMPVVEDLFTRTEQEAKSGAKIIFWSEGASMLLKEDEAAVIERGRILARQEHIYLQLGLMIILNTDHFPFMENRAIMIDPSGHVIWDYAKAHPTPGEASNIAPGSDAIPTVDTPYGRIATVICYDADFASFMRPAGQAHVDILLDPSLDWNEVKVTHDQMATLRAIENGVSLVRATSMGLSSAVDYHGRRLASIDYFNTDTPVLVTLMPIHGTSTVYTYIGDIFAYLCIISLVALTAVALWRRRQIDPSVVTEAPVNVVR